MGHLRAMLHRLASRMACSSSHVVVRLPGNCMYWAVFLPAANQVPVRAQPTDEEGGLCPSDWCLHAALSSAAQRFVSVRSHRGCSGSQLAVVYCLFVTSAGVHVGHLTATLIELCT